MSDKLDDIKDDDEWFKKYRSFDYNLKMFNELKEKREKRINKGLELEEYKSLIYYIKILNDYNYIFDSDIYNIDFMYDEMVNKHKDKADAYYDRGSYYYIKCRTYNRLRDYENVTKYYKKVSKDFENVIKLNTNYKNEYDVLNKLINSYYYTKQYHKIIELKDALISYNYSYFTFFIGSAYINLKEYDNAIDIYDYIISLKLPDGSNTLLPYYNKALCYHNKENYEEAINNYKECLDSKHKIKKNSNYLYDFKYQTIIDAYDGLLRCCYDRSQDLLKEELDINYEHLNLSFIKAIWYCRIYKWDKAIDHILIAFENDEFIFENFYLIKYIYDSIKDDDLKENLIKLNLICEELKLILRYISSYISSGDNDNDNVSHYTNINNLKYFFINEQDSFKFRMNNVVHMNDPEEGTAFINLLSANNKLSKFMQELYPKDDINVKSNTFLASFSKSDKEILPMWNTYANNCNGCKIDVPTKLFDDEETITPINNDEETGDKLNSNKYCLYKVIYLDENNKVKNDIEINRILKDLKKVLKDLSKYKLQDKAFNIIRDILDQVRFLFKSDVYDYEQEYRVVKCISDSEIAKYGEPDEVIKVPKVYIELNKDMTYEELSVILGVKVDKPKEVATYLKYLGVKEVKLSKMPYK